MLQLVDPSAVRRAADGWRADGERIGFVPTMGALHAGHISLVQQARAAGASRVAVSIFVNPTQFGPEDDLDAYPRDLDGDAAKLVAAGVDLLFLPEASTIYPPGAQTRVSLQRLPRRLCGASRPGHFEGVATVVALLFNIVRPHLAVFGEKDFQQLQIIRQMSADLHTGVRIVGAPIVREPDGLAMSSRNAYLAPSERRQARCLSQALDGARALVAGGERDAARIRERMTDTLLAAGAVVDYVALVDPGSLEELSALSGPARALLAAHVGPARLIDNMTIDPGAATVVREV